MTNLSPINLSLRSLALALVTSAGLASALQAQAIAPNEGEADFGVPAPVAPATVAPAPVSPGLATADLQFENVDIAELLMIIGKTFDINVSISGDVKGNIAFINLKGKTPEQAIRAVATTEGLKYRKDSDGTYIIGRNLPGLEEASPSPLASPANDFGGIKPSGLDATVLGIPKPNGFGGNNSLGIGSLPPISGEGSGLESLSQRASNGFTLVEPRRAPTRRGSRTIRVRNVKASIMAYWLDPVNNPIPQDFINSEVNKGGFGPQPLAQGALQNSRNTGGFDTNQNSLMSGGGFSTPFANPYLRNQASSRLSSNRGSDGVEWRTSMQFTPGGGQQGAGGAAGTGGGTFELPGDIERILAVDPQNVILVAGGSDEDIRQLQEIINVLDRPLRQVEIEAQFVNVTTSDSRSFGIDFQTSQGNFNASNNGFAPQLTTGSFSIGFVRGNFQAQLRALLSKERAKVLTAPRVTAINNLTASITSSTSQPVILNSVSQSLGGQQATAQQLIFITTSIGLTVTPTINGDDTITVVMQPELSSQAPTALGVPVVSQNRVSTIANVKDGDTIALGGLRTKNISRGGTRIPFLSDIPFIGPLFQSRNAVDTEGELIIFVTARIVRRAGDDEPVAGT